MEQQARQWSKKKFFFAADVNREQYLKLKNGHPTAAARKQVGGGERETKGGTSRSSRRRSPGIAGPARAAAAWDLAREGAPADDDDELTPRSAPPSVD